MSKQIYPDNGRVEEADIFDSNIPLRGDTSRNQNDSINQEGVGNDQIDEVSVSRTGIRRERPPNIVPTPLTRTRNSEIEIEINNSRPQRVRFDSQQKSFRQLLTMRRG